MLGMFGLTALEICKHDKPDITGLGVLAGGLAVGVGTIIWGHVQEDKVNSTTAKP